MTKVETLSETFDVFEIPIACLNMTQTVTLVLAWATARGSPTRVINFTNVHMLTESRRDSILKLALLEADLNLPDGMPVSWIGRLLHGDKVSQISGPDFMPLFCDESSSLGVRHFFYGGGPGVAEASAAALQRVSPNLLLAGCVCPPFRPLSVSEERALCDEINEAEADVIWVCLGCPKQELWIARNRKYLKAKVILAVGQAVDILAGTKRRAPAWMHNSGLEWLYRLVQEPGRLWKRYLTTNSLFLLWITADLLRDRFRSAKL